jgi:hypothetical protein
VNLTSLRPIETRLIDQPSVHAPTIRAEAIQQNFLNKVALQ